MMVFQTFFSFNPFLNFVKNFFETFNILYYPPTLRYCAHYEDNLYNPYTTEN